MKYFTTFTSFETEKDELRCGYYDSISDLLDDQHIYQRDTKIYRVIPMSEMYPHVTMYFRTFSIEASNIIELTYEPYEVLEEAIDSMKWEDLDQQLIRAVELDSATVDMLEKKTLQKKHWI